MLHQEFNSNAFRYPKMDTITVPTPVLLCYFKFHLPENGKYKDELC